MVHLSSSHAALQPGCDPDRPGPPGPAPDPKILRPAGERARGGLAPPPGDMSEGAGASWAHFLSAPSRPAVRRPAGAWTRPADSSHSRDRVGAGRRQGRAGRAGRAAEGDARASSWAPQSGTEGWGGGGGGRIRESGAGWAHGGPSAGYAGPAPASAAAPAPVMPEPQARKRAEARAACLHQRAWRCTLRQQCAQICRFVGSARVNRNA
jgi:hypothetical protein